MTGRSWLSVLASTSLAGVAFGCLATATPLPEASTSGPVPNPGEELSVGVAAPDTALIGTGLADSRATDQAATATAILTLPQWDVTDAGLGRLEAALARLSRGELQELAEARSTTGRDQRFGLVYGELAFIHAISDEPAEARRYALRAREAGVSGRAERIASAVLGDGLAGLMPADPVIGAVLPVTGSPSNREYTRLFMEGVEVAMAEARALGWRVEFLLEDNRGTQSGSERGASALVSRGAQAILGPLHEENLESAVRAVSGRVAFLSPTARRLPVGRRGAYSIGAGDRGAGRALAEAVRRAGYDEAVVVHPRSPGELLEAGAFENAFDAYGGIVRRRLQYEPGTTTFDVELKAVETLVPQVLVLAAPPADVQLIAPQFAFFGLDTLGIQVAGTGAWTTPAVLESVARRHTDSVIAVSTANPEGIFDPADAFVAAYERHFRRTLLSPVPAVGYDLVRIALVAYRDGVRTSRGTVAALERLDRFRGATGTYSHVDGRLDREFFPVRIIDGELHPVEPPAPMPPDTIGVRPGTAPALRP